MTLPCPDVVTFGECLISLRSIGPIALGATYTSHLAGAESNVAIGLARLGHSVSWCGRVGDDELGEQILRGLRAEGVRLDHVRRGQTRPTGVMFLEQRSADLVRVLYHRADSAGSAVSADDLRPALALGARLLHLSGVTPALSDDARAATTWAADTAARQGIPICLDVNYRTKLWSRALAREVLSSLTDHADIVIASDDELDLLAAPGDTEDAAVRGLLERGVQEVVVKRGADGASAHTVPGSHHEAALPVTAVDTVGAGDAFTAGYLSGLLDGLDVPGRLHRGIALGAFCVSTRGDWEGLPRRDELPLLEDHRPGSAVR